MVNENEEFRNWWEASTLLPRRLRPQEYCCLDFLEGQRVGFFSGTGSGAIERGLAIKVFTEDFRAVDPDDERDIIDDFQFEASKPALRHASIGADASSVPFLKLQPSAGPGM